MFVNKYKPVNLEPKTRTAVRPVVAICWLTVITLMLVFARDFDQWADARENSALQAMAKPLAAGTLAVSNALGIQALRAAVEGAVHGVYDEPVVIMARAEAAGPEAGDDIEPPFESDLFFNSADPIASGETADPAEPVGPPAPDEKPAPVIRRVLIIGASSIQEGLGTAIERKLEAYEGIEVKRYGRYSSGLARLDYYDWNETAAELKEEFQPDLVVAQWGGNDCQGLTDKRGSRVAKFNTEEWDAEYGSRVKEIVSMLKEGGCEVVLIGMPNMRPSGFRKNIERMNSVTQAAVEEAGGVYLSTWELTSDAEGKYLVSAEFNGKTRRIRAGDGIHFSTHGSKYAADALGNDLAEMYGLEERLKEGEVAE